MVACQQPNSRRRPLCPSRPPSSSCSSQTASAACSEPSIRPISPFRDGLAWPSPWTSAGGQPSEHRGRGRSARRQRGGLCEGRGGPGARADRRQLVLLDRPLLLSARLRLRLSARTARLLRAPGRVRARGRLARRREHGLLARPPRLVRHQPGSDRDPLPGRRRLEPGAHARLRRGQRGGRLGALRDLRDRPRGRGPLRGHRRPRRRPSPEETLEVVGRCAWASCRWSSWPDRRG